MAVKEADARKNLVAAFEKGVADNKGIAAKCFNPRHGIRVTQDGKTADFVICFECSQFDVYSGPEGKVEKGKHLLVGKSPEATFNKVLKDAGSGKPKQR